MINRTSPARAGFSLIEVLVVLAVAGLFFAMGSALLYGYLRLNNASAYQLDSLTTWRDMADAWKRKDMQVLAPRRVMPMKELRSSAELLCRFENSPPDRLGEQTHFSRIKTCELTGSRLQAECSGD